MCKGCGESHDMPWGFCGQCTACILDMTRPVRHRLNDPAVLEAHVAKMAAYERSKMEGRFRVELDIELSAKSQEDADAAADAMAARCTDNHYATSVQVAAVTPKKEGL